MPNNVFKHKVELKSTCFRPSTYTSNTEWNDNATTMRTPPKVSAGTLFGTAWLWLPWVCPPLCSREGCTCIARFPPLPPCVELLDMVRSIWSKVEKCWYAEGSEFAVLPEETPSAFLNRWKRRMLKRFETYLSFYQAGLSQYWYLSLVPIYGYIKSVNSFKDRFLIYHL